MEVIIMPRHTKNLITTIAIGEKYYFDWKKYAMPSWIKYCKKYDLGLIVFTSDLIDQEDQFWKKATWQKMLLGDALKKGGIDANNICYLDTDIIINFEAPNIFSHYKNDKIGLVSLRNGLPFPREEARRRLAFLRNRKYDSNYPLDSALFMSIEDTYEYHGLAPQADEACMGLILFNLHAHSELMKAWFYNYDKEVKSVTNNGDQTHANYEIQRWGNVQWLDYRFQAIWVYEMAWKYPFLYEKEFSRKDLINKCIESSLYANYFLHFAGSWNESDMWRCDISFSKDTAMRDFEDYYKYLKTPVFGKPVGKVNPSKK